MKKNYNNKVLLKFLLFFSTISLNCSEGSLDTTFGTNGVVDTPHIGLLSRFNQINGIAIQSDNKIVAAGQVGTNTSAIARYNPDGSLDTTFNPSGAGSGIPGIVFNNNGIVAFDIAIDSNNKILIAGTNNLQDVFAVARFNTDGSLDATFNPTGSGSGTAGIAFTSFGGGFARANALIVQTNRIVLAGAADVSGNSDFVLAAYDNIGALDATFNPTGVGTGIPGTIITSFGGGTSSEAFDLILQTDGRYVAGGANFNLGFDNPFAIARYNIDGSLDMTFGASGLVTTSIQVDDGAISLALQADGKIVAGGYSGDSGFIFNFGLVRYETNGSLDTTFNGTGKVLTIFPGASDSQIYKVLIQSSGKIIGVGFTNPGSGNIYDFALARYNANGSLDPNFGDNGLVLTDFGTVLGSPESDDFALAGGLQLVNGGRIIAGGFTDVSVASGNFALAAYLVDLIPPTIIITAPAEGSIINNNQPLITGQTEAGLTVNVSIDSNPIGSTVADGVGIWSLPTPTTLSEGLHSVTATTEDTGGNIGTATNNFTVDTTAPNLTITNPSNNSVINDNQPLITGTTDPNLTVQVSIDGNSIGSTVADSLGIWSVPTPSPLSEGLHTVSATTQDAVGNVAITSNTFTVDTNVPNLTITNPADGSIISNNRPLITGESEPGLTVQIQIDGIVVGSALVDSQGIWSLQSPVLNEGEHIIVATTQDAAGNTAVATSTFNVDTVAPLLTITQPKNGQVLTSPVVRICGRTEAGLVVTIRIDNKTIGQVTADTNGNWCINSPTLSEGNHTISAIVQDAAGNLITFSIVVAIRLRSCIFPADALTRAIRIKYS